MKRLLSFLFALLSLAITVAASAQVTIKVEELSKPEKLLPIWKIVVAKGVFGWLTEQKKRWKPTIRLHCLSGEHSKENVHDTGDVWLTFGR